MSLILEALKKLDREKQAPERGFLVMAAAPWPSSSRSGMPALVLGLLVAMGAGAGLAYWLLRPAPTPGSAAAVAATAPVVEVPTPDAPPVAMEATAPTPFATPARVEARVEPRAPEPRAVSTAAPTATPARVVAASAPERAASASPTPRVPAPAVPSLAPPFTLEAISLRDGSPIAVINGRLLHEGDVTNGITVVKIGTESVELEIKGVRQIVRF